jgi:hypothetical protein
LTLLLERSRRGRSLWFSPLFREVLRIAPYFALHYEFEKLLREDAEAARIWEATPVYDAVAARAMRRALFDPITPAIRADVDGGETPVYTLSWRVADRTIPPESALGYLLATNRGP